MIFKILSLIIMAEILYFSFLEIFFWEKPRVRRSFGLSSDFALRTKKFALNFGVLRLFLGISFIFGFIYQYYNEDTGDHILVFSLFVSMFSSIISAFSFNIKFLFLQAIPSIIALIIYFNS